MTDTGNHSETTDTAEESKLMNDKKRHWLYLLCTAAFLCTPALSSAQEGRRSTLTTPREQLDAVSGFELERQRTVETSQLKPALHRSGGENVGTASGQTVLLIQSEDGEDTNEATRTQRLLKDAQRRFSQTLSFLERQVREAKEESEQTADESETERREHVARRTLREHAERAQQLRQSADALERELAQQQEKYGPNHPQIRSLKKRLEVIAEFQRAHERDAKRLQADKRDEDEADRETRRHRALLRQIEEKKRDAERQRDSAESDAHRDAADQAIEMHRRAIVELREKLRDMAERHEGELREMQMRHRNAEHAKHEEIEGHHHDPREHDERHEDHEHAHHERHEHGEHIHHEEHDEDGHHHHGRHEGEHERHEAMERIRAMYEAAERLGHGGLHEMAEDLHHRAEAMERELHGHNREERDVEAILHETLESVELLRREIGELHEKMDLILRRLDRQQPAGRVEPGSRGRVEWHRIERDGDDDRKVFLYRRSRRDGEGEVEIREEEYDVRERVGETEENILEGPGIGIDVEVDVEIDETSDDTGVEQEVGEDIQIGAEATE